MFEEVDDDEEPQHAFLWEQISSSIASVGLEEVRVGEALVRRCREGQLRPPWLRLLEQPHARAEQAAAAGRLRPAGRREALRHPPAEERHLHHKWTHSVKWSPQPPRAQRSATGSASLRAIPPTARSRRRR